MIMGENYNLCLSAFDDVVEKIAELQMDITKKSLIKVDIKFSNGVIYFAYRKWLIQCI